LLEPGIERRVALVLDTEQRQGHHRPPVRVLDHSATAAVGDHCTDLFRDRGLGIARELGRAHQNGRVLACPLHDLGDLPPQVPAPRTGVADADQDAAHRIVGGLIRDGDHPPVSLGLETVAGAGIELVSAGPDRLGQERCKVVVIGGDVAREGGAKVVPCLLETDRIVALLDPRSRSDIRTRTVAVENEEPARGDAPLAVFLAALEHIAGAHANERSQRGWREGERWVVIAE
jgi:hypothetical protein